MPCYITGSREGDDAYSQREAKEKIAKRLQETTELLCIACQELDMLEFEFSYHEDLREFWNAHKKQDGRE